MKPTLTTILLATDGSPDSEEAERAAIALADLTGAALYVIHAWHVPVEHADPAFAPGIRTYVATLYEEQGQRTLAATLDRLALADGAVAGAQLRHGRPTRVVLDEAATLGADLIVTGSRGSGQAKRVMLGSVAEGIVRGASCPVLIVRGEASWPPTRIVIGDDESPESRHAAELAALIGGAWNADALLVRAVPALPPPGSRSEGAERAARFQEEALGHAADDLAALATMLAPLLGRSPQVYTTVEDAAITLIRLADEGTTPSLIAVGTHGAAPAGQLWLGSTALEVLTCATGSVLICPHRAMIGV